ncbi:MAG: hypothetical protein R2799_05050 [Crocinitomicaceae bacterium]
MPLDLAVVKVLICKTIGGYHGAKLKKYQEVWSFYFDSESKYLNPYTGQKVLNMLNTRYIMGIPQGQYEWLSLTQELLVTLGW